MQPAPTDEEQATEPASVRAPGGGAPGGGAPVAAATCPVAHAPAPASGGCPVADVASAGVTGCPVARTGDGVRRSRADLVVRHLLRIRERPAGVTDRSAYGAFQRSMLISAVRCTLTYVVFPFVAPAVGVATGVGPVLGILIGTFAIVCDVFTIRRFFTVDHRWRWPVSTIAFSVICLLAVLLVQDLSHLLR